MKTIYLIRHGESEGNAGNEWQGEGGGLTERGRVQTERLADRLKSLPFEALVSSPLHRARETADILAERLDKEIAYSDLFVERRKPSEQTGMARDNVASLEIDRAIVAHFGESGWRYADEENFDDMKARGIAALAYLSEHPADTIAVVTHGYFMRVMLACALSGEALTPEWCAHFITSFRTANTGISLLYHDQKEKRPWWLWTWNDHSHLSGE